MMRQLNIEGLRYDHYHHGAVAVAGYVDVNIKSSERLA